MCVLALGPMCTEHVNHWLKSDVVLGISQLGLGNFYFLEKIKSSTNTEEGIYPITLKIVVAKFTSKKNINFVVYEK